MPKKVKKQLSGSAAAGAANLAKWQAEEGHHQQATKHGAYSDTVRQRYSDLRTTEGKKLKSVIDSIINDLGGPTELNAAQNVVLGGLRGKFIVVFQISEYLDRQTSIIDNDGQLLACLGKNFLGYTDSIRRDLETLYGMSRAHFKRKVPRLEDLISESKDAR